MSQNSSHRSGLGTLISGIHGFASSNSNTRSQNLLSGSYLGGSQSGALARGENSIAQGPRALVTTIILGSGRSTVGKSTGPKWSKMVQMTILVKMTLFRTGFSHSRDQNGPKWCILVHFGLKRSILVHLGPPTVLWPFLIYCAKSRRKYPSL